LTIILSMNQKGNTRMQDEIAQILQVGSQAAKAAGAYLFSHFGTIRPDEVDEKGRNDFVTFVDRESEKRIVQIIREAFPHHAVLAEEGGNYQKDGTYQWIIDPLDGTTNYIQHIPFFCVSLGVRKGSEVVAAIIYDPNHDELFTAARGQGAWLNGKPISVSANTRPERAALATGYPWRTKRLLPQYLLTFEEIFLHTASTRRLGSAAMDLCYVAAGRFDAFWEMGLSPWDIAAGSLLVQEAGGVVTDFWNGPHFLETGFIIAGNSTMHRLIQEITGFHFKQFQQSKLRDKKL